MNGGCPPRVPTISTTAGPEPQGLFVFPSPARLFCPPTGKPVLSRVEGPVLSRGEGPPIILGAAKRSRSACPERRETESKGPSAAKTTDTSPFPFRMTPLYHNHSQTNPSEEAPIPRILSTAKRSRRAPAPDNLNLCHNRPEWQGMSGNERETKKIPASRPHSGGRVPHLSLNG